MQILSMALTLCLVATVAQAQPTRIEIETALTRMLWSEAGSSERGELDRTVILFAIHRLDKQERHTDNIIETLSKHIGWWDRGYPPHRPWLGNLDTTCERPAGFPKRHGDWKAKGYHTRCYRIVKLIRDYYEGRLRNPCNGTPNNWRGRGKASRKAKRKYYQVGCGRGSLHNWFDTWRQPNGQPTKTIRIRKLKQRRRALRHAQVAVVVPRPDR